MESVRLGLGAVVRARIASSWRSVLRASVSPAFPALPARGKQWLALPLVALALAACAPVPPKLAPGVRWEPSPNFNARRPNLVVLHHTSNATLERALGTLTSPLRAVSAHYLIGRDGAVIQLVDEQQRAWHAGRSWWGGNTDVNSASIGIELDNDGGEPFAEAQLVALLELLAGISERYDIPRANFVAHADVAPDRKADPSAWFPWRLLAVHGFGLWCDAPYPPAPEGGELMLALGALGYSPLTPEASRRAFLLHYAAGDESLPMETEKALAYCLLRQRAEAGPSCPAARVEPLPPAAVTGNEAESE